MGKAQEESKLAVDCGYWPLYRFNPELKAQGKNPFSLDSKAPDGNFGEFLAGEVRYASLQQSFPDEAKELAVKLEYECMDRYACLKQMASQGEAQNGKIPAGGDSSGDAADEASTDPDACTLSGVAEHARFDDAGEPCDDGRAGKG